jgi:hypothetical protein
MTTSKNAADPQNDRELFFKLEGKLEKLIFSIDHLADTFKEWKTTEFAKMETTVEDLLKWKNQEVGKWKALTIGIGILTLVSLYLAIKNAA